MRLEFAAQHAFPTGFRLDAEFETSLHEHRVTVLFGPSGSGKSTILNIIAGLLRPQQGRVRIGDRMLADTSSKIWLPPEKRRLGVVFQDHRLFPHLTVAENLRYGMDRKRRGAARFDEVVEVLEIGGLLERRPGDLSGGECQRTAIGRALLRAPELLLFDEPLSAVDRPLRRRIMQYLVRVIERFEIPALYVTHSQAEARRLGDRMVLIDNGRILRTGRPDEVLVDEDTTGWPNASGPINVVRLDGWEIVGNVAKGRIGENTVSLPLPEADVGRPAFVQFSPNEVVLATSDLPGISARNHLKGKVCRVVTTPEAVFLAIDVGQLVWAEITHEALRELELSPGSDVFCLIKTHAFAWV
ncbi:MAG: molybdenum ABC transporter ATP-binding protein [Planctomycetota bacterium]|nr:MAG: molybdenum ABC transporter ATP-binding protein [Planctomycetota bacterium]